MMLTLLFIILMCVVFGKLIGLAIKAAWGITKILFTIVLLPLALIALAVKGLIFVAIVVLVIMGIIALAARC